MPRRGAESANRRTETEAQRNPVDLSAHVLYVLTTGQRGETVRFLVEGVDGGSISMLAVQIPRGSWTSDCPRWKSIAGKYRTDFTCASVDGGWRIMGRGQLPKRPITTSISPIQARVRDHADPRTGCGQDASPITATKMPATGPLARAGHLPRLPRAYQGEN